MPQPTENLASCLSAGDADSCAKAVQEVYDTAVGRYRDDDLEGGRRLTAEALSLLSDHEGFEAQKGLLNRALSDFNYLAGRHREALLCSHAAAEHYSTAGEVEDEVGTRGNYASLLLRLGDLRAAYEQLNRTLEMASRNGMPREEGQARLNISDILHLRGEYDSALEQLEKAGSLFVESGYEAGNALCFDRIAKIKYEQGDYEEATEYHESALESRRGEGRVWERLMLASGFARTLIAAGSYQRALDLSRQTLQETEGPEQPDFRGQLRLLEAEALLELGRTDDAAESLNAAAGLFFESQGNDLSRAKIKRLRARTLMLQGRPGEAFELLQDYIDDYEEGKKRERDRELAEMRIAAEVRTAIQRDRIAEKNRELELTNASLRNALSEVRTLSGMLPICANCNRIRDDKGYWQRLETYISSHSAAQFTHGLCSDCMRKLYPELAENSEDGKQQ